MKLKKLIKKFEYSSDETLFTDGNMIMTINTTDRIELIEFAKKLKDTFGGKWAFVNESSKMFWL